MGMNRTIEATVFASILYYNTSVHVTMKANQTESMVSAIQYGNNNQHSKEVWAYVSATCARSSMSVAIIRPTGTQAPTQCNPSCFWAWTPSTSLLFQSSSYCSNQAGVEYRHAEDASRSSSRSLGIVAHAHTLCSRQVTNGMKVYAAKEAMKVIASTRRVRFCIASPNNTHQHADLCCSCELEAVLRQTNVYFFRGKCANAGLPGA